MQEWMKICVRVCTYPHAGNGADDYDDDGGMGSLENPPPSRRRHDRRRARQGQVQMLPACPEYLPMCAECVLECPEWVLHAFLFLGACVACVSLLYLSWLLLRMEGHLWLARSHVAVTGLHRRCVTDLHRRCVTGLHAKVCS